MAVLYATIKFSWERETAVVNFFYFLLPYSEMVETAAKNCLLCPQMGRTAAYKIFLFSVLPYFWMGETGALWLCLSPMLPYSLEGEMAAFQVFFWDLQ